MHLRRYRIAVCKKCKYAVLPKQLDSHLAGSHHRMSIEQRRTVRQEISIWPQLIQNEAELNRLRIPDNIPEPFEHLIKYTNGRKCKMFKDNGEICGYICCDLWTMQKHCKQQHNWVNELKRGDSI